MDSGATSPGGGFRGQQHGTPRRRGRPLGRRAGKPDTREMILRCARARFGAHGYDGATLRDIANDAQVDVALIHYFFGTKDRLFAAAMALPATPADAVAKVLAEGNHDIGRRLVHTVIDIWDDPESGAPLLALLRSAATHEHAALVLRQFIEREVLGQLARALDLDEPELQTSLVASQVIGLLFTRYVLRIGSLASADRETLAAAIGPTLDRYLAAPLAPDGPASAEGVTGRGA